MKRKFTKVAALLLVAITLINVAACSSCSMKDKWDISAADYESMKMTEVSSSENDGTRYVTLTATDTSFKADITVKNIRVVTVPIKKETIDSMSEEELAEKADELFKETDADDVKVVSNDDKTLSISFKEPDYDYLCLYFFYVHKDAVTDNVFTIGFDNVYLESSVTPEAKITTLLKNGQENPVIEIKLTNATAAANIKTEDVTLSGALKDMKVTAVTGNGDTITVTTEGTVRTSAATYAYVQLSAPTNDAEAIILAMTDVEHFDAFVNAATFALENGILRFDIDLLGTRPIVTETELSGLITLDGFEVTGTTYFEDQNIVRLFVRSDAADVDEAVDAIFGKTLKIDGTAVGGDGITVEMTASSASFGGVIESIEKVVGEEGKFRATAQFYPRNGSMVRLTLEDFGFLGDFEGAVVTKVENVDNVTVMEFIFSANPNRTAFNGYVEIAEGKLFDLWGAESANTSAAISYALETSRRYTALEKLVDKIDAISKENFAKDVVAVINAFQKSGITKFFSGDIIGALSALFSDVSPNGIEDEILTIVTDMKLMMQNLDRDVKDLKNSVQEYGDDILSAAQKNTLLALESKWNAFNTNYMERLDRTVTSFNSACRRSLVDYVKSEHGAGLTLHYDGEGKLAILDKTNSYYSVDAKKIDDSRTVTIPLTDDSFTACQAVFDKTGFKYTNDLAIALMTDLGNAVKAMNDSGNNAIVYTEETGEILFQYLYQQMMFRNLTNEFMDNLRADFVNFCKQITDGQKVLDSFYEMMKYKYNFQSEALSDIENIRDSLLVVLYSYGTTAAFVENYDSASDNHDMSEAIQNAIRYIKSKDGLYEEPEGYSYCYAVGRPITLRISGVAYDLKIKFHAMYSQTTNTYTPDLWNYDGYEDNGAYCRDYFAYHYDGTGIFDYSKYNNWKYIWQKWYPTIGYYINYRKNTAGGTSMMSDNILSAKDLRLIKARFVSLRASGKFPSYNNLSFGDYLTNGTVVHAPAEYLVHLIGTDQTGGGDPVNPTRIATAGWTGSEFPVDGTRTLIANKDGLANGLSYTSYYIATHPEIYANYKYGGGTYFKVGEAYAIGAGSGESGKAGRDYFQLHKEYTQTIYDITTDTMQNDYPVLQVALYGEHHGFWTCDEGAYFYNEDYNEPYFIFPIG